MLKGTGPLKEVGVNLAHKSPLTFLDLCQDCLDEKLKVLNK